MSDKKPSYYLEVWRDLLGGLIGSDVSETKGFPELKEWFEYHYTVFGKTATVYIFFSDYDIRDEELKAFAVKFMKGEYITYSINLGSDSYTMSKGMSKIVHPHQ